eukprot:2653559-Rhodomonas_salina.2
MPEVDDTAHKHKQQASLNTAFNSFNVSGITDHIIMMEQAAQPMAFDALRHIGSKAPVILYIHNGVNFSTQLNSNGQIQSNQGQQQASSAMITDCSHCQHPIQPKLIIKNNDQSFVFTAALSMQYLLELVLCVDTVEKTLTVTMNHDVQQK